MSTVCDNCFLDIDEGDLRVIDGERDVCYHLTPSEVEAAAADWAGMAAKGIPYEALAAYLRAIVSPEEYAEALENYG